MGNKEPPGQKKPISYRTQHNLDIIDPRVRLSRSANKLFNQVGNDLVLQGLEPISFDNDNDILNVYVSKGTLIQDYTLIDVLDNFSLSLDISNYDLNDGLILVYSDFQSSTDFEENNLKFKIGYKNNNNQIDNWDDERNKIILFSIEKNPETGELDLSRNPYYIIDNKQYSYKGLTNCNLTNIWNDWSVYLDYFGRYTIREYFERGNPLHEYRTQLLSNDFTTYNIHGRYDLQRLMIDYVVYDNDKDSQTYGFWVNNYPNIYITKEDGNITIENQNDYFIDIVISFLDEYDMYHDYFILPPKEGSYKSYSIENIFENTHMNDLSIQVFRVKNGVYFQDDSYSVSKDSNTIYITNKSESQLNLHISVCKNMESEIGTLDAYKHKDYNIDHLFDENNISPLGVFIDVYEQINGNLRKPIEKLSYCQRDNFIRIINKSDESVYYNVLFSKRSTYSIDRVKCSICDLLYEEIEVHKIGNGDGNIYCNGDIIDSKNIQLDKGNEFEFIATPNEDSVFVSWYGCDSVIDNKCYIKPFTKRMIRAEFVKNRTLTLEIIGNGNVYSRPMGIHPESLDAEFRKDSMVFLVAIPDNENDDIIWNGGEHIGNTYQINHLIEDKHLTVQFGDNNE